MKNLFNPQSYPLLVSARLGLALTLGSLAVLALIGLVSASSPPDTQTNVPAPGDLDAGFGVGGIVTTPIGLGNDFALGGVIQEDGKIILAGCQQRGSSLDFALVRYTASGELDASFGSGGIVTTAISSYRGCAEDVAVQQDGKIVVAGYADSHGPAGGYNDFVVVRYTVSGTLDITFGSGGIVTTSVPPAGYNGAESVAIQPDGKIVAVGTYCNEDSFPKIAVVRYTISGTLDHTFGSGGIVTTSVSSSQAQDLAYAIAAQDDGKIVVAGSANSFRAMVVLRYTVSGTLDTAFGSGGVVTTSVSSTGNGIYDIAVQDDGRIVAAGAAFFPDSGRFHFALLRYTALGTPDETFGSSGVVTTIIGPGNATAYGLAIQRDGKIVAAGSSSGFALVRYTPAGALDPGFGSGGVVTTSIESGHESAQAVALQRDGKIVVAGYANDGGSDDFAVARYYGRYNVYLPLVLKNNQP
jgi:uncharacterized delta-60 repeat protein